MNRPLRCARYAHDKRPAASGYRSAPVAAMARVLGGDKRHLAKYTQRPGADVTQIADRRGDDIKRTHSGIRTTAGSHRAYLKQEMRIVARFTAATSRPLRWLGTIGRHSQCFQERLTNGLLTPPPSPLRRHPARSLLQLPSSTLGELPRTPQASTQQLLKQAEQSDAEQAAQLRLAAADQSIQQGNRAQARSILQQVQLTH